MTEQLIYGARERYSSENKVKGIHGHIANIMLAFGGKIINSSYILSEGIATEAYGNYEFIGLGKITTILTSKMRYYENTSLNHLEYNFCVNFLGFERNIEKYNKIKNYLNEILRRVGLNMAERK